MGKKKRINWNVDRVKEFVEGEEGNGCEMLSEKYVNMKTKMWFKCKCKNNFSTTFDAFRNNDKRQCNSCSNRDKSNNMKLSYEYVKMIIEVDSRSGCKLLSKKYEGNNVELIVQCKCNNKFTTTFSNFTGNNKRQCNVCGKNNQIKARAKTNEEFKREVYDLVGDEYLFLEEYIDAKTKIKCRHNKCGREYNIQPSSFLSGTRCAECFGNIKKTTEQFKREVHIALGSDYYVIGEYTNNKTKIKIKHLKCGKIYEARPDHTLSGVGCSYCYENVLKTDSHFKREVYNLVRDEYLVEGEYIGSLSYIDMKHSKCGHKYKVYPSAFLAGRRCPHCNNMSKGEERIMLFLKQNNICFKKEYHIEQCRGKKRPLPFDYGVLIKETLISLIEYDGEHHFEPVNFGGCSDIAASKTHNITKQNDNIKNQYCKDNNIPLLRIPYWEFDNIEQILEEWLAEHGILQNREKIA